MLDLLNLPRLPFPVVPIIPLEQLSPGLARALTLRLPGLLPNIDWPARALTRAQRKCAVQEFGRYTRGRKVVDLTVLQSVLKNPIF
jgi:hypothetical protein